MGFGSGKMIWKEETNGLKSVPLKVPTLKCCPSENSLHRFYFGKLVIAVAVGISKFYDLLYIVGIRPNFDRLFAKEEGTLDICRRAEENIDLAAIG